MGKREVKEKEKKTLRYKIMLADIMMIVIITFISGFTSVYFSYNSASTCLDRSMSETASVAAQSAENKIAKYITIAQGIAADSVLCSDTSTNEEKLSALSSKRQNYSEIVAIDYYNTDGISASDGKGYDSSEFFQTALKGETYVSVPDTDKTTGELVINISTPVRKSGASSQVVGVASFLVKQEVLLNSIVENIKLSEKGDCYIVDKNGYTIADYNIQLVKEKENIIEQAESNSSLKKLVDTYNKAIAGEAGFLSYRYEGVKTFVAYAPIEGSDSWSMFIEAPVMDFMQGVIKAVVSTAIIIFLAILIGTLVTAKMTKSLSTVLVSLKDRLIAFSEGDVSSPVPEIRATASELDSLKTSFIRTTEYTNQVITDIDNLLTEMSHGNFTVNSKVPDKYIGDYKNILAAFERLRSGMNESFTAILEVSEQVSESSLMVSSGAQTLAQGSTEQASSIQELSSSVAEISQRIKKNAEDSEKAQELSADAEQIMQSSIQEMQLTLQAMDEISSTSNDISKVIKAIDDIAFQTNILALNAAVEAARAGSAGKGFAVVADEVRNLSQKSAEAAKNTTALIESTIAAVEKGTQLVSKTSAGFNEVAAKSSEVEKLVERISAQALEQANEVSQVSTGIEQVSAVVQMNSATSEESAAASEELSSQAESLKGLVEKFKLDS